MAIIHSIKKRFYDATGTPLVQRQEEIPRLGSNFDSIRSFFNVNLVECRVRRRIYPAVDGDGYRKDRHFLCTSNFYYAKALSIAIGKPLPKVKHKRPKAFYRRNKMLLVYCLTQGEFRMLNFDKPQFTVIDYIPFKAENLATIGRFMQVNNIKKLPEGAKKRFHNS